MDLQEFELLWPNRENLPPELSDKLEKQRRSCPDCQAFADGGSYVRELISNLECEKAPDNFAYKMRIYAVNNKNDSVKLTQRSGFRWASLAFGITTGAALFALSAGPLNQSSNHPESDAFSANPTDNSSIQLAIDDTSSVDEDKFATELNDSLDIDGEDGVAVPAWQLRTVSSSSK